MGRCATKNVVSVPLGGIIGTEGTPLEESVGLYKKKWILPQELRLFSPPPPGYLFVFYYIMAQ